MYVMYSMLTDQGLHLPFFHTYLLKIGILTIYNYIQMINEKVFNKIQMQYSR